jgi:hypothetical protein
MAYSGEYLRACGVVVVSFKQVNVIAVSGDGPNVCGHLLLHVPSGGGYYLHVAGLRDYPKYMTEDGYKRYLKDNKKTELRRVPVTIPNPGAAYLKFEELLSERWTWLGVPNNCVTFVEEILKAGGNDWASVSNCPVVATQESLKVRLNRLLSQMEYALYGVRVY